MITESAILNVRPGQESELEKGPSPDYSNAGVRWHGLHRGVETSNRYLLLVSWRALEGHTIAFRKSERYPQWRELLHDFYDPFPTVEHFDEVLSFEIR
jgi:heme-degrading monooxygenase HmoA